MRPGRGEMVPRDSHPIWCELGPDCTEREAGAFARDPLHIGHTSILFPTDDDVRIEVQRVRQDDLTPNEERMLEGPDEIVLRLTNTACLNDAGKLLTAHVRLTPDDARAIAHMLSGYARLAEVGSHSHARADVLEDGEALRA